MIQSMYTVKKKLPTQGDMIISADTGSFNWSTKNAVFNGNVIVNGEPKNGEVIYNVREKVFVN